MLFRGSLSGDIGAVDLCAYLEAVCEDLQRVTTDNRIVFEGDEGISMNTDRAVLVALLIGELVTNAAKHAYAATRLGVSMSAFVAMVTRPLTSRCATTVRACPKASISRTAAWA